MAQNMFSKTLSTYYLNPAPQMVLNLSQLLRAGLYGLNGVAFMHVMLNVQFKAECIKV